MKSVLIFDRPFTRAFTRYYREARSPFKFLYISDFKFRDDVGLISRQYRWLNSNAEPSLDIDYETIRRRDRFLRFVDPTLAFRLIRSAYLAMDEILNEVDPAAVVGLPMDNYYLDLLDQLCVARGIPSSNPVQSFLPGRTRITRRGEWQPITKPTSELIERYAEILRQRDFRPSWLSKHRERKDLLKIYIRERAKKVLFETLKVLKRDPYSFHYNCIYPMPGAITVQSLDNVKASKLFVGIEQVTARVNTGGFDDVVFFPLQFSPESSLDYNISDVRFSEYDELIKRVIAHLSANVLLLVKEHPDLYGYRHPAFYDAFLNHPNVILVDVSVPVQKLFQLSSSVLVTGGASTGAEAALKGLNVTSLGGAFYADGMVNEILSFDEVHTWPLLLRNRTSAGDQGKALVERILANSLEGPYDFVRSKSKHADSIRSNVQNIVEYLAQQQGL
jgi:hypothetical protein